MSHSRWFLGTARGVEWGGHPEERVQENEMEPANGGLDLLAVTNDSY